MYRNLTPASRTILNDPGTAAGATDVLENGVDTLNFDSVRIILVVGTVTAGGLAILKAQSSLDNGVTDPYTDLAGSAGGGNNKSTTSGSTIILDIHRPNKRFVRPVVVRSSGTANVVVTAVIVELYRADTTPVIQDASLASAVVLSEPTNGTA